MYTHNKWIRSLLQRTAKVQWKYNTPPACFSWNRIRMSTDSVNTRQFPTASAQWSAVSPSSDWPRDTQEQLNDYVYHGRVENLPRSTAKIVRIFLSSTFTDTTTERNLLMKNVFPELRRYCRDKYDVDFQVHVRAVCWYWCWCRWRTVKSKH